MYLPDSHLSLPLPRLPSSSPFPLMNTCPVGREVDHHTHDWASTDVELPQAAFSWPVHLGEALRPSYPRTCPVVLPPWDETWFSLDTHPLDTHRCISKPRAKGAVRSAPAWRAASPCLPDRTCQPSQCLGMPHPGDPAWHTAPRLNLASSVSKTLATCVPFRGRCGGELVSQDVSCFHIS